MSKVKTEYKVEDKAISYEVVKNGYDIYLDDTLWITQHEPYIPDKNLTYEENAIAQIEEIVRGFEETVPRDTEE